MLATIVFGDCAPLSKNQIAESHGLTVRRNSLVDSRLRQAKIRNQKSKICLARRVSTCPNHRKGLSQERQPANTVVTSGGAYQVVDGRQRVLSPHQAVSCRDQFVE